MRWVIVLLIVVMSAPFGAVGRAQEALDLEYPELVMTATDYAFEIAEPGSAGLTLITLVNEGAEPHHAQVMQLAEGRTFADVETALGQDPGAIFGLGQFVGGPSTTGPGEQSRVILDLAPGQYVALCFVPSPDGVPHVAKGMVQSFEIAAADTATTTEPEANATVVLTDFAFEMPTQVSAGPQIWEIVNEGPQPHEIDVLKLAPGVRAEQVLGMFGGAPASPEAGDDHGAASPGAASPAADGPPPYTEAGGISAMGTGLRGWAVIDLEPGDYVAVCFVPDPASGQPHLALGMVATFTVE